LVDDIGLIKIKISFEVLHVCSKLHMMMIDILIIVYSNCILCFLKWFEKLSKIEIEKKVIYLIYHF
jgi:hypothetical protein